MTSVDASITGRFRDLLERLGQKSIEGYYNPYRMFAWPASIPTDQHWMSDDLISIHGTDFAAELGPDTTRRLSHWESVNFYSLNVHGIRELITEVVRRVHTPGFEVPSEFFHHFIGEENEHMWFFAEFCRRYGGKIYSQPKLVSEESGDPDTASFLVFARILLFEEIVDFYNARMAEDETLHPTIRQVNRVHHEDESRHIAFGRELVSLLYDNLRHRLDEPGLREIERYLKRYLMFSLGAMYNPHAYRDAGVADPLGLRNRLLADERRRQVERKVIRKPLSFLLKTGIFRDDALPAN